MDVAVEAGAIRYRVRDGKGSRELPRWAVLHIRNLSLDGVLGASPIRLAREAIGLSLATEEAAARLWGSGGVPREAIRIPGITQPEQWEQWRAVVERVRGGLEGSHRVQVLPAEWQLDRIGIPPADAEYIETRRFQILDIARIYRVPPHMLGLLEKSSYASIEQQAIEFVQHALLPWLRRIEQAIRRDVIPPWEPDLYAEHLVDGLLRGDIESRYRAYAIARQWGWMSANEIRARENMEPIPGGDRYLEPLNMAAIASTGGQGGQ
jgi:HK97 family phage portal protein